MLYATEFYMKSQDLKVWINYLEGLNLSSKNLDLIGLDRVKSVAKKLDLINPNIPVITVAGTNGKGSVVALLESILVTAGYNTGSYTTPFLISFNEQFRIDQKNISDNDLCEYFNLIAKTRAELEVKLTMFEFKFLASLLFFKNNKLDVLVLEVGLGGEYDAVNMIDPTVAVIASISLDHLDWFGNDINNIARAKAGIFRAGQQAVYGGLNPPDAIMQKASELGTEVFYVDKDFNYKVNLDNTFDWVSGNKKLENVPMPKLLINNTATALMAIELLQDKLPVSKQDIYAGVKTAFVLGRQQVIQNSPLIIADVAHNEDSVLMLKKFLLSRAETQAQNKKIIAVFSAMNTKELDSIIKSIGEIISEWHIASLDTPRSYQASEMEKAIRKNDQVVKVNAYKSIKAAYQAARDILSEQDCLVAFGSFLVVEQVLLYRA